MTENSQTLEKLRSKFLDLTLRNNQINYRYSTLCSLVISKVNIEEIYSSIVLNELGVKFIPCESAVQTNAEDRNNWKYPNFSEVKSSKKYLVLPTPCNNVELRKKLYHIQNKSKTILDEQGYSILYLALGFINWKDPKEPEKILKAPLILIPVQLTRQRIKDNYILTWTGEEPCLSLSLITKFQEYGVNLPEFTGFDSIQELSVYIDSVSKSIMKNGWTVTSEAVLDLFSFKKQVMYRDLDVNIQNENLIDLDKNSPANVILNPLNACTDVFDTISESELDKKLSSVNSYNVTDVDSSQLAVIEAVKAGHNLVVEGPPGTGKSQTIVNIIAEMLALGKTVLFVSEKMAALDVVRHRLENIGLSDFCLELHSRTANKRLLLHELERTLQSTRDKQTVDENINTQLDLLRIDLDNYCDELEMPIGRCGFNPHTLIGIREQCRIECPTLDTGEYNIHLDKPCDISYEEYTASISALSDIVSYSPQFLKHGISYLNNPWDITHPKLLLPPDKTIIKQQLTLLKDTKNKLLEKISETTDITGIFIPNSDFETKVYLNILWCIVHKYKISADIINNPLWKNSRIVNKLNKNMREIFTLHSSILKRFIPEIFSKKNNDLYSRFASQSNRGDAWKKISGEYKLLKKELENLYLDDIPEDDIILIDLKQVDLYRTKLMEWTKDKKSYISLYSSLWKEENTNPDDLVNYYQLVSNLQLMIEDDNIDIDDIESIFNKSLDLRYLKKQYNSISSLFSSFTEIKSNLFSRLDVDESQKDFSFTELSRCVDDWIENIESLSDWSRLVSYMDSCSNTSASCLLPYLINGKISADHLVNVYKAIYADQLLAETYAARPELSKFSKKPHEDKIKNFASLDIKNIVLNSDRIILKLENRLPDIYTGGEHDGETSVLLREFNKKSGHLSIRSLMHQAGGIIQKIKPCLMMSPLSIAQYLDIESIKFDLVIFDEASQIKPEDALGALMRGKQLVVMGDSRQLPPTSFFDQITEIDEDNYDIPLEISDVESLLHVCKQVYPTKRLKWHYRSRHDSLIYISNHEFYDNNLLVFPSKKNPSKDIGLSFVYLPNTVYDRGKSGTNREEAKAVAMAVINYYKKFPNKSVGVATFSTRQQEAIKREIEKIIHHHPDIETLMYPSNGEEFFVKNLETIQGDERDTILISLGYGYDEHHKLSNNFGPLNQNGGERRLNVLITRARERCVVFANFHGRELQRDTGLSVGIDALAKFMIYAETDVESANVQTKMNSVLSDSFSDTVARILLEKGYTLSRNIGCSTFKIDIAVYNPKKPDEYLAGIMCDGQYYYSSKVARDRDRLKPQNLELLGWNIIRIWSLEWYQKPEECKLELLQELMGLMNNT